MIQALPFVAQGSLMIVDELFCHRRRLLRRWERVGHPLDTGLFLLCLLCLLVVGPSQVALAVFAGLSVLSCIFITKDEWQHRELCSGFENWLHALLFMLHPVVLVWAGCLWWWHDAEFFVIVGAMAVSSFAFAGYQAVYWNFLRRE